MSAALDIAVLVVIGISVFLAAKQGFFRSLISLCGGIVSMVLAGAFGSKVGVLFNDMFVGKMVRAQVVKAFANIMNVQAGSNDTSQVLKNTDVLSLVNEMPDILKNTLKTFNIDPNAVSGLASNVEKNASLSVDAAKESIINYIATPLASAISYALGFLAVFLGCSLIFIIIGKCSGLILKAFPFLGGVNLLGGVAMGLVRGILIVCILSVAVVALSPAFAGQPDSVLSPDNINHTVLFKPLYNVTAFFIK